MRYDVTITLRLKSRNDEDRVSRQLVSLFEWGTIRESIAEGLHLDDDPKLVDVVVLKRTKPVRH